MKERSSPRRQPRTGYLTREQLDELCEKIIVGFGMEHYGQELNPVPTEVLPQLLEGPAHATNFRMPRLFPMRLRESSQPLIVFDDAESEKT